MNEIAFNMYSVVDLPAARLREDDHIAELVSFAETFFARYLSVKWDGTLVSYGYNPAPVIDVNLNVKSMDLVKNVYNAALGKAGENVDPLELRVKGESLRKVRERLGADFWKEYGSETEGFVPEGYLYVYPDKKKLCIPLIGLCGFLKEKEQYEASFLNKIKSFF